MSDLNLRDPMPESDFTTTCSKYLHFDDTRLLSVRRRRFQAALNAFEADKAVNVPAPLRRAFLAWLGALPEQQGSPSAIACPWNGDGLPPVGTICRALHEDLNNGQPVEVEILKHHESGLAAAFLWIDGLPGLRDLYWGNLFEPILTPEQIREKEVEKMVEIMGYQAMDDDAWEAARRLYDAGCHFSEGGAK